MVVTRVVVVTVVVGGVATVLGVVAGGVAKVVETGIFGQDPNGNIPPRPLQDVAGTSQQ